MKFCSIAGSFRKAQARLYPSFRNYLHRPQAIKKANLSFQLKWAKKQNKLYDLTENFIALQITNQLTTDKTRQPQQRYIATTTLVSWRVATLLCNTQHLLELAKAMEWSLGSQPYVYDPPFSKITCITETLATGIISLILEKSKDLDY